MMDTKIFFILVPVCITTHIIRSVYEIVKHKKILNPNRLSFVIMFANMALLWTSWFTLCGIDPYRITLPGIVRYLGISFVGIGVIFFSTALVTIKSLETFEGDLITGGVYKRTRHPMYLGFILWLIGFPVYNGALFAFFLSFVFIANVLFWRFLEEKELEQRFPAYMNYKKTTLF